MIKTSRHVKPAGEKTVKVTLTLPADLRLLATEYNLNLSALLRRAVEKAVEWHDGVEHT